MTKEALLRTARVYTALVGAMDFLTGIGLLVTPALTLRLMGAGVPANGAIVFVRLVGVFVAAVGASYLWTARASEEGAIRTALTLTIFFRVGAGTYAGAAVLAGWLEPAWLLVAATDLACVAAQSWFLQQGVRRET